MNKITDIKAEAIKDSRGNPTLKVCVCSGDLQGIFEVPSGASTGVHEAVELRDKTTDSPRGVSKALSMIEGDIKEALLGMSVFDQQKIDEALINLDGTDNFSRIGGNSAIGVSIAVAKVASKAKGVEVYEYLRTLQTIEPSQQVPYLFVNLINGGKHAEDSSTFQEHQIIPMTNDVGEAYNLCKLFQKELGNKIIKETEEETLEYGDEGGFIVHTDSVKKPFQLLNETIKDLQSEVEIKIGTDVAASSFYNDGKYEVEGESLSSEGFIDTYKQLVGPQNIWGIEDPFEEEDFDSFATLTELYPDNIIIGDDLTVTNKDKIEQAAQKNSINAVIIKPNQNGTLTGTLEAMKSCRNNNMHCIVSHRSGETNDSFVADLAYAFGCFGLKSGAPGFSERDAKYNRLIEIYKNDK